MVEGLAGMLGLQKVGWIFSHPAREKGCVLILFLDTKVYHRIVECCSTFAPLFNQVPLFVGGDAIRGGAAAGGSAGHQRYSLCDDEAHRRRERADHCGGVSGRYCVV